MFNMVLSKVNAQKRLFLKVLSVFLRLKRDQKLNYLSSQNILKDHTSLCLSSRHEQRMLLSSTNVVQIWPGTLVISDWIFRPHSLPFMLKQAIETLQYT